MYSISLSRILTKEMQCVLLCRFRILKNVKQPGKKYKTIELHKTGQKCPTKDEYTKRIQMSIDKPLGQTNDTCYFNMFYMYHRVIYGLFVYLYSMNANVHNTTRDKIYCMQIYF